MLLLPDEEDGRLRPNLQARIERSVLFNARIKAIESQDGR